MIETSKERQKVWKCFFDIPLSLMEQKVLGKAEATAGGVETKEICPHTMESHLQKGLYFVGEVLDVTGQLGGHNFQWAWAVAPWGEVFKTCQNIFYSFNSL